MRSNWFISAPIVAYFFTLTNLTTANETPIRDIREIPSAVKEVVVRVQNAKVILADYALIKEDFPHLGDRTDLEIDDWLINHTAYITKSNALQDEVNTPISLDKTDTRIAYRPYKYGRALVFDLLGSGLIDAKGVGATDPDPDKGNGLLSLGEAICEYVWEKTISIIFDHNRKHTFRPNEENLHTVGAYAVIDFGFDVKHKVHHPFTGLASPAGIVLRQAHRRHGTPGEELYNFLPAETAIPMELVLRKYGVTSAGTFYVANLQGSTNQGVIDFGTYSAMMNFNDPLLFFDFGAEEIQPEFDSYVQPHGKLQVPYELYGHNPTREGTEGDAQLSLLREKAHQLAQQFRDGEINREEVRHEIEDTLLGSFKNKLHFYDLTRY